MESEVPTHGWVPVEMLMPWELLLVLGNTRGQRWVTRRDLVKPLVIAMLLATTQLLTFVSTTNLDLQVVGVHCKGGTGRRDYGNVRFFAKKQPKKANGDLFGSKGFFWN